MAYIGSYKPQDMASSAGQSLGSGIGGGVNALLEGKLDKLQQQASFQQFKKAGYPDEAAQLFSMYRNNPGLFKLLQNYEAPQQQGQQEASPYDQLMGNAGGQPQGQPQEPNVNQMQQGQNPMQGLLGGQQQGQPPMPISPPPQSQARTQPQPIQSRVPSFKKKQSDTSNLQLQKDRAKWLDGFKKSSETSDAVVQKVKALKQLAKNPVFKTGYEYQLGKSYLGLPRVNQLADKIIAELTPQLAAANQSSGGRITDAARELAERAIPNPYEMTREGMIDAADALENIYSIPVEYAKTATDVFKKNKNSSIEDLKLLTDEAMAPEIAKRYKSIIPDDLKMGQESDNKSGIQSAGGIPTAIGRATARTAESLAGFPGDAVQLLSDISGAALPESAAKLIQSALSYIPLPTSETLNKLGEATTGKFAPSLYGQPQGGIEEQADKYGSLLGSILFPLGGPAKSLASAGIKPTLIKGMKLAGLGTLAGFAGKTVGGKTGEKIGTVGTILLANMGGPSAWRSYAKSLPQKQGNEILKAMAQPSKIHEYIKSAVPSGQIKSDLTKTVLGLGAYGLLGLKGLGKVAVAGAGAGYAEKALRALNQSPEFRHYFYQAILSAAKDNKAALAKYALKMDKVAQKQNLD